MASCPFDVASEEYLDFIERNDVAFARLPENVAGIVCRDRVDFEYSVLYALRDHHIPLSVEKYTYNAIPKLYTLLDTSNMESAGISPVLNQPSLNFRGEGTIIGFIDTGIDYQNTLFQNPDKTTRILRIWDQSLPKSTDSLLSYGSEYTKEQIDEALSSEDPLAIVPSTDTNGHGTFMAGIAAGGVLPSEDFFGAAPDCQLAIVKLKSAKQYLRDFYLIREDAVAYQENDIMMAVGYLRTLAQTLQMPLTIFIGLGTNQGSHDGTSPLSLVLRNLSTGVGILSVVAAGNETGYQHHYLGNIAARDAYEEVEIRVAPDERGFTTELWARQPEYYTVGFVSPTGEVVERIPIILGNETKITFTLEETVITLNYRNSEIGSGSQLIFMRFQAPTPGIWRIRVYNSIYINGTYHIWLPVHGFVSEGTVFLKSNPDTTVTEPGNATTPITVSTYDHRNNSIYIHSSRGFSRDGRIKPELAAPGVNVFGPGLGGSMTRRSGSSVAAAHVAGAVANLLTWSTVRGKERGISDAGIKGYLIRGAQRNPALSYPNKEFGYGTLDLYQTFIRMRE